ncbi:MAG TPA: hypothetical protein VGG44_10510 [Tepidisphaeraceae bacterium]|jgi:hypothetical protein
MSATVFKYSCPNCHRTFTWKKEVAGKRGKCKCGQFITVPLNPPQDEPSDDFDALAELSSDAKRAVVDAPPIVVPSAAIAAPAPAYIPAQNLNYRGEDHSPQSERFNFDNMNEPVRDLFVPTAMLVAGFLGAILWVFLQPKAGPGIVMIMAFLTGAATLIKTAILIGLAFVIAPRLGISFGLVGPAILKFAAIIILVDTAELWMETAFKASGAISANGRTTGYIILPRIGLATTLISLSCYYLFSMDRNDVAMFAVPAAFISWLTGFIMNMIVIGILAGMIAALHHKRVAQAAPIAPPAFAAIAATLVPSTHTRTIPAPLAPTPFDGAILKRIQNQSGVTEVFEGNQWKMQNHYAASDRLTAGLIDQMYNAGAVRVYIDTIGVHAATGAGPVRRMVAYVQLPADPKQIQICHDIAESFRLANGGPDFGKLLPTKQFLIVALKP